MPVTNSFIIKILACAVVSFQSSVAFTPTVTTIEMKAFSSRPKTVPLKMNAKPPGKNAIDRTESISPPIKTRSQFLHTSRHLSSIAIASLFFNSPPQPSQAFEGGVGGLGKVKPQTGVIFRNDDMDVIDATVGPNGGGTVTTELLAPDGTPTLLSFYAPWPLLKSTSGIESRGLSNPESAFVLVSEVSRPGMVAGDLGVSFFLEAVFGQAGKFGAYGSPTDVKVKKISSPESNESSPTIYAVTFTTLTPAMRESDRKAYISTKIVGNGVFMLVTTTTAVRFKNQEKVLMEVANSFQCAPAPKSNLRNS